MAEETQKTLRAGIERSGLPPIEADNFKDSVDKRMQVYKKGALGQRIQVYINVGGGTTSVGKSLGKKLLHSGLNFSLPYRARNIDSVMTRFLNEGVAVIHLVRIHDLAKRYGLPVEPTTRPDEGQGNVFVRHEYNRWYTLGMLAGILLCLYLFIRSDWGFRIFQTAGRRKESGHPEPMV
jgi:hypothetical protein